MHEGSSVKLSVRLFCMFIYGFIHAVVSSDAHIDRRHQNTHNWKCKRISISSVRLTLMVIVSVFMLMFVHPCLVSTQVSEVESV